MTAISPFVFEDHMVRTLVRIGNPWFHGGDVCQALGISNVSQAISRLDDDEVTLISNEGMTGPGHNFVNEPGVYRLTFTSRKPEAERFKRWLAHEVLPQLRRNGRFGVDTGVKLIDGGGNPMLFQPIEPATMDAVARMRCVDLASRLHGREYGRQLYRDIGLPRVAVAVPGGQEEAVKCLDRIVTGMAFGSSLLDLIVKAMDEDIESLEPLRLSGILTQPRENGFIIANRHDALEKLLENSEWCNHGWGAVLRRLPGALGTQAKRFQAGCTSRGTFLPLTVLDLL